MKNWMLFGFIFLLLMIGLVNAECTENDVKAVWDSIFKESSVGAIVLITPDEPKEVANLTEYYDGAGKLTYCSYVAYKYNNEDFYMLGGSKRRSKFIRQDSEGMMNTTSITGLYANLTLEKYNSFLTDIGEESYYDEETFETILTGSWLNERNTGSQIEAESIFKSRFKYNSNWNQDGSGYRTSFPDVTTYIFSNSEEGTNLNYDYRLYVGRYTAFDIFESSTRLREPKCDWDCEDWSKCIDDQQTRTCTELDSCGNIEGKPLEDQSCIVGECVESWVCKDWGACINNQQTRTCTEYNGCGTTKNKLNSTQACISSETNQSQEQNGNQEVIKTKYYIGDKEVKIEGKVIKIDDEFIETSLELIFESGKIYVKTSKGNKEIKILLEDAINYAKKIKNVERVEIREEKGEAVYSIFGTKKARLFFIFPISAEVRQDISVEDGKIISTKRPWWHFFALGV